MIVLLFLLAAEDPFTTPEQVAYSCENIYPYAHEQLVAEDRAFLATDVLVRVEWRGAWGTQSELQVDATGAGFLTIARTYGDTDTLTYAVAAAPTIAWANQLLEAGFFTLPDHYDSSSDILVQCPNGNVYRTGSSWEDTGEILMTLQLGDSTRTISMIPPSPLAPQPIRSALQEMLNLRKKLVGDQE